MSTIGSIPMLYLDDVLQFRNDSFVRSPDKPPAGEAGNINEYRVLLVHTILLFQHTDQIAVNKVRCWCVRREMRLEFILTRQ